MQQTLRHSLLALAVSAGACVPCLADDNFIRQPRQNGTVLPQAGETARQGARNQPRGIQPHGIQPRGIQPRDGMIQQPGLARKEQPVAARTTAGDRASATGVSVLELVPPSTSTEPKIATLPASRAQRASRQDASLSELKWVAVSPSKRRQSSSAATSRSTTPLNQQWNNASQSSQVARSKQVNSWPDDERSTTRPQAQLASARTRHDNASEPMQTASFAQKQMQERQERASKISLANLRHANSGTAALPPPADAPEGWIRVGDTITQHLRKCDSLVKRRAYFSARDEALKAARYLVRLIDEWTGRYECEPSLNTALLALDEAEQFGRLDQLATSSVRGLIESHSTPALDGMNVSDIAPLVAAKHYRLYATDALVYSSLEHPWMSQIYYTMGRIYQAQAESAAPQSSSDLHWRAVTFYRAAAAVDPQNAIALDQLGYVFLQLDKPDSAREALVNSLRVDGSLSALQNLAEASRRLGDATTRSWALQNHSQLAASKRQQQARPFVQVPPRLFVQATPRVNRPTYARPVPQNTQAPMQARPAQVQPMQGRVANVPGYQPR